MAQQEEKSLVGFKVALDPKRGGMWFDSVSKVKLSHFEKGVSSVVISEDTDVSGIVRGIKSGNLRVYDKSGKDVSINFGGVDPEQIKKKLVTLANEPVNEKDKHLRVLLNRVATAKIIADINGITDVKILSRLLHLEESGYNPTANPRLDVLETIEQRLNDLNVPIVVAKKQDSPDEVITLK